MSLYGVKVTNICPSMIATEMTRDRKFKVDSLIQVNDITKTLDYLLSLGRNGILFEIIINCFPFVEKLTEASYKIFELD